MEGITIISVIVVVTDIIRHRLMQTILGTVTKLINLAQDGNNIG